MLTPSSAGNHIGDQGVGTDTHDRLVPYEIQYADTFFSAGIFASALATWLMVFLIPFVHLVSVDQARRLSFAAITILSMTPRTV